ncbi:MAG: hypothetical protein EBU62_14000 [Proteobacteria bacterium]|nr:hypothetical protein [Pseudomonadota bacterium]
MVMDPDTSGPSPFGGSRIQALDEDPILIACALRFDGWKYIERMGFDHVGACEAFITSGVIPALVGERMAVFFGLQRYLYKWGGEMEPRNGRYWRAFRAFFLLTCADPVPDGYAFPPLTDRWDWNRTYAGAAFKVASWIQHIHDGTEYEG